MPLTTPNSTQGTTPWVVSSTSFSSLKAQIEGPEPAGASAPGRPIQVGGNDGGGLVRELLMDTLGRAVVIGGGTAGSPNSGVETIQGIASMTPVLVAGAAASGSAVANNPVLIGGSDGTNAQRIAVDTSGRQILAGSLASYLSGNGATTTLKSGAGILRNIAIADPVATSSFIVYDNTAGSGTKLFTYSAGASAAIGNYTLNAKFSTGLTIVTTGTPCSAFTVSYD